MQLTLAVHPITDIQFGTRLSLDGSALTVDGEELRRLVLEDAAIDSVDFDIVRPGESCRAGPIFDVVEPRAKADGGSDFPGIIGAPTTAGIGTTHVLAGAAVSVLAEMSPDPSRSATGRVLEMSGSATAGSAYSKLCHLLVVPQTKSGLPRSAVLKAYRVASVKVAVRLARAALAQHGVHTDFDPIGAEDESREGLSAGRLHRPDFFAPAQTRGGRADSLWDQYRRHAAASFPSRRMARRRVGAVAQFLVRRHRDLFLSESSGGSRTLPAPSRAGDKFRRHGGDRRRQSTRRPRSVNATRRQIWPNGICAPTAR